MKNRKAAVLAAILAVICVFTAAVYAVGENEDLPAQPETENLLVLDSFDIIGGGAFDYTPYESVAFSIEQYDDFSIGGGEITSGKGLLLSLKSTEETGETATIGISGTAAMAVNLKYYTNLSFAFASSYAAEGKTCSISLELSAGEESVKYSRNCVSGQWTSVVFDISDIVFRDRIDAIKIEATVPSDPDAEEDYIRLETLAGGGYIEKDIYDRFMAGSYLNSKGEAAPFEDGKLNFSAENDQFLDADLPAFSRPNVNGIYFEIENTGGVDTLVFEYMIAGDSGYTEEKRTEIKLSASDELRVYYAKLPDIASAVRWRISSKNGTGELALLSVMPIELGAEAFPSVLGTTSGAVLSDGGKYLRVSGSISSSVVSKYSGSRLGLYVLAPGTDIEAIGNGSVSPIATTPISMDFNFKIPISESFEIELSKKFTVVITDRYGENGEVLVVGAPSFVSNPGAFSGNVSATAKDLPHGIISGDLSDITATAAGFTVIDVDLDRLFADGNSGELHSSGGEYRYYNSDYVAELDHKVRSLYGVEVYFRLIQLDYVITEDPIAPFAFPNVSSEAQAYDLYMVSEFLAGRYSGGAYGSIHGIIVGQYADNAALYDKDNVAYSEYVAEYADALCVIRSGAVRANPNVKVFAACSDSLAVSDSGHSALTFIDALSYEMKERGDGDWYAAVDSERAQTESNPRYFTAASAKAFSEYLMSISAHYSSGCDGIMYIWHPDSTMSDPTDNYVYAMLTFMKNTNVTRFAVDIFEAENKNAFTGVLNTGYLSGIEPSGVLADALARDSADFVSLISEFANTRMKKQQFAASDKVADFIIGEHAYFDFNQLYSSGGWYPAENCGALTSIFSGVRRLNASFVSNGAGGYMAMGYRFEYPENMSLAPYVSFDVEVPEEYGEIDVTVIFGSSGVRAEYNATVSGREKIVCDLSEFDGRERVEYIKLLALDRGEDIDMSLYSVKGHSAYYTDESLESAILAEREKARNETETEYTVNRALFGVAVAVVAVFSVLVFLALSRKRTEEE